MIELMVVIGIIGIMLLFAIPNFGRIYWENTRSSVYEMAQEFRSVRERALARGLDYIVEFRPGSSDYRVHIIRDTMLIEILGPFKVKRPARYGGPGLGPTNWPPESAGSPDANGLALYPAGGNLLTFDHRGGSSGGAVYFNNGTHYYAIGIWRTGRIKVWTWTGETTGIPWF